MNNWAMRAVNRWWTFDGAMRMSGTNGAIRFMGHRWIRFVGGTWFVGGTFNCNRRFTSNRTMRMATITPGIGNGKFRIRFIQRWSFY